MDSINTPRAIEVSTGSPPGLLVLFHSGGRPPDTLTIIRFTSCKPVTWVSHGTGDPWTSVPYVEHQSDVVGDTIEGPVAPQDRDESPVGYGGDHLRLGVGERSGCPSSGNTGSFHRKITIVQDIYKSRNFWYNQTRVILDRIETRGQIIYTLETYSMMLVKVWACRLSTTVKCLNLLV